MDNLTGIGPAGGKAAPGSDGDIIRVLVADDCPLLREGIRRVIERERNLVLCGLASNLGETLDSIPNLKPHVVLIAFSLRDEATFTLIEEMRERHNRTPLLILAIEDDHALMERAVRAGAPAFVSRAGSTEGLVEAIHRLVRGLHYTDARAVQSKVDQLFAPAWQRTGNDSHGFTEREQEILKLIGGGLMPREIADALRLSVKTVESHRHNIKQKLGVKTSARLAHYAFLRLQSGKSH